MNIILNLYYALLISKNSLNLIKRKYWKIICLNFKRYYTLTLNHKITNNSMKFCIIIITTSTKFCKITASFWSMIPVQFNCYLTHSKINSSKWNFISVFVDNINILYSYEVSIIPNCGFHDLSGIPPAPWIITESFIVIIMFLNLYYWITNSILIYSMIIFFARLLDIKWWKKLFSSSYKNISNN